MLDEIVRGQLYFYIVMAIDYIFIGTNVQLQLLDGNESPFLERLETIRSQIDSAI